MRVAWAAHLAALGTEYGLERAARLEPDNCEYWLELGRFWQYNLDNSDSQKAIAAYRKALANDPHSAEAYINLATACNESENDIAAARENFLERKRPIRFPPKFPGAWANFFCARETWTTRSRRFGESVQADPSRGAEAFSRSIRVEPNIKTVLDRALPDSPTVYLDIIHDLSDEGRTTEALIVWDRLVATQPSLSLREIYPLVNALRSQREYTEATRVWQLGVRFAGLGISAIPRLPCYGTGDSNPALATSAIPGITPATLAECRSSATPRRSIPGHFPCA